MSDNHLFKELPFGGICPKCGSDTITFYDTNEEHTSGRYKCSSCGRDTVWGLGKAYSFKEVLKMLEGKL